MIARAARSTPIAVLTLVTMVLGGECARADAPHGAAAGYLPMPGRASDSRPPEPATQLDLQRRLDVVAAAGASECGGIYQSSKAQAWLNFSKYAAAERLPVGVREAGLGHVESLVVALETQRSPITEAPELPTSRHIRDDLWREIQAVKRGGRLCAAPKMTAYCEVQLAWAGYEAAAGGVRHVDPYVRIAEDYCAAASAAMPVPVAAAPELEPMAPPAVQPKVAPEPTLPQEPVPSTKTLDLADLSLSVLFPHNRSARADIRRPGRAELKRLAAELKTLPAGTAILVVGHADPTGHAAYNNRLSRRRATSVIGELTLLGVNPAQIRVEAAGSNLPVVQCAGAQVTFGRRRYLSCLEPNRRVMIELIDESR